jgi:RNAse (barnase) inhibitor barstar
VIWKITVLHASLGHFIKNVKKNASKDLNKKQVNNVFSNDIDIPKGFSMLLDSIWDVVSGVVSEQQYII